jgi:4-hydroxy-tetrahydrodipicolinate reductase
MITKIVITGCCGRMGRRIASLAAKDKSFQIHAAIEAKNNSEIGNNIGDVIGEKSLFLNITDDLAYAAKGADIIIDFTTPVATLSTLSIARCEKIPIVIGTTGIKDEEQKVIESSAKVIPVLYSSNMSIGVNVLFGLVPAAAAALGEDYDIEIIESHHNKKKDAPSGTAKTLLERISQAKGKNAADIAIYGRDGNVGQRPRNQIGVHAVRAGGIVGEHTVIFAGENETVVITHRANSRDIFAKGALMAAKYITGKSPGLYNMENVIEGI